MKWLNIRTDTHFGFNLYSAFKNPEQQARKITIMMKQYEENIILSHSFILPCLFETLVNVIYDDDAVMFGALTTF